MLNNSKWNFGDRVEQSESAFGKGDVIFVMYNDRDVLFWGSYTSVCHTVPSVFHVRWQHSNRIFSLNSFYSSGLSGDFLN